jgi:myo-inositol catabolism protein IolC
MKPGLIKPAVKILFAALGNELPKSRVKGMAQGRTIWIDPRHPWLAHTLLHELLHLKHTNWSETKIREMTTKLWKRATWKQKASLLKVLATAEIEEKENG